MRWCYPPSRGPPLLSRVFLKAPSRKHTELQRSVSMVTLNHIKLTTEMSHHKHLVTKIWHLIIFPRKTLLDSLSSIKFDCIYETRLHDSFAHVRSVETLRCPLPQVYMHWVLCSETLLWAHRMMLWPFEEWRTCRNGSLPQGCFASILTSNHAQHNWYGLVCVYCRRGN